MRSSYLITGAQGFVGRYLTAAILRSHPAARIVGTGRSKQLPGFFPHSITGPDGPCPAPIPIDLQTVLDSPQLIYRQADLLDRQKIGRLLDEFRPAKIVHLASGLRDDPRQQLFETNVEGTARLFEAAGELAGYQPEIILGSSGGVYGHLPPDQLPLTETTPRSPVDEYSVSKLSAELLARLLSRRFGFQLKIARIFNILGPGQDERHLAGRIAAQFMRIESGQQKCLALGSLTSTRDFIDVRDVASALLLLVRDDVPEGVYNVGTGLEHSVNDVLAAFFRVTGLQPPLQSEPPRPADIPRHFADIRLLSQLSFKPCFSLSASVSAVWQYYRTLWMLGKSPKARL